MSLPCATPQEAPTYVRRVWEMMWLAGYRPPDLVSIPELNQLLGFWNVSHPRTLRNYRSAMVRRGLLFRYGPDPRHPEGYLIRPPPPDYAMPVVRQHEGTDPPEALVS